jgi:hypothetical protein
MFVDVVPAVRASLPVYRALDILLGTLYFADDTQFTHHSHHRHHFRFTTCAVLGISVAFYVQ